MLESGLAWSCTGLVHAVAISVGLYENCPCLHVSETLFHCCHPLLPALTYSLLPFCKGWAHSQSSLCLTISKRPGPHCSSQCVCSWCVIVKSLSSYPCWPSVYLFLLWNVWMFGLFLLHGFLLKLEEHHMPWLWALSQVSCENHLLWFVAFLFIFLIVPLQYRRSSFLHKLKSNLLILLLPPWKLPLVPRLLLVQSWADGRGAALWFLSRVFKVWRFTFNCVIYFNIC